MVVIHEYTHTPPGMEEKPEPEPEELPTQGEPISEERAFWIGLTVVSIIFVLILVGIVGRAVWNHRQQSKKQNSQVLGTQQQPPTPTSNQPLEINQTNIQIEAEKEIIKGGQEYSIESGDTLATIGAKFNVDWKKIAQINKISEPYTVRTGQKLIIPKKD